MRAKKFEGGGFRRKIGGRIREGRAAGCVTAASRAGAAKRTYDRSADGRWFAVSQTYD